MKEFMYLYIGGDHEWMINTPKEEIAALMERWGAWMGALQAKDRLVSGGSPLNYGGKRMTSDKVTTDIAASEFKELISGYSIVKAETIEEAIEFAKDCPIFESPDITLEIREVTQMD